VRKIKIYVKINATKHARILDEGQGMPSLLKSLATFTMATLKEVSFFLLAWIL
jgi:hypothetical protein